jgi:hypothetical protein
MSDGELEQLNVDCDCGDAELELRGDLAQYHVMVNVDCGDFTLNGVEQGTPYETNESQEKQIVISDAYGDVSLKLR